METRRGMLRRGLRGAISGAAALLLAACSGPARVVFPTSTATTIAPTATLVPTPTLEPTREPPRPRPAGTIGAGVGVATPAGTPRVPPGFARGHLRVIHAAPALPAVTIVVDGVQIGTVQYPEATAYADILYGTRRIEGVIPTGAVFAVTLDAQDAAAYTIVVATDGATPRAIMLNDDQPAPAAGQCRLRFLPLDPEAGALDLALAAGLVLASGIAPFTVGPPVAVPVGRATLEVRTPGQSTPLFTKPPVALDEGDRYTAVLSGRAASQTLRLVLYPDAASG